LWISVGIIAVFLCGITFWQFFLWQNNELSQFLIPPHNGWNYFIFYTFTRFWLPYLVSGVIGLLGLLGCWQLNKRTNGRFFYKEEFYFLWIAVFLTGHPGWILYVVLLALVTLVYGIYTQIRTSGVLGTPDVRLSLYYLWLPTAIVTILLNQLLLINWEWYSKLLL